MTYGLPAIGEADWGEKVNASIEATKELADVGGRDTGLRLVAPANGYTGSILLERIGSVVHAFSAGVDGSTRTNEVFCELPLGFQRPGIGAWTHVAGFDGDGVSVRTVHRGDKLAAATAGIVLFDLSWTTRDPWPDPLPGSAL